MEKLNIITTVPRIRDLNNIIYKINEIIDKLNEEIKYEYVQITKRVKDYHFFKDVEVAFPYHSEYTISNMQELNKILDTYNLDKKNIDELMHMVKEWIIVWLTISIDEEMDTKEKKQEEYFETIETIATEDLWNLWNLLTNMWVDEVKVKKVKEKKPRKPGESKKNDNKWKKK